MGSIAAFKLLDNSLITTGATAVTSSSLNCEDGTGEFSVAHKLTATTAGTVTLYLDYSHDDTNWVTSNTECTAAVTATYGLTSFTSKVPVCKYVRLRIGSSGSTSLVDGTLLFDEGN